MLLSLLAFGWVSKIIFTSIQLSLLEGIHFDLYNCRSCFSFLWLSSQAIFHCVLFDHFIYSSCNSSSTVVFIDYFIQFTFFAEVVFSYVKSFSSYISIERLKEWRGLINTHLFYTHSVFYNFRSNSYYCLEMVVF